MAELLAWLGRPDVSKTVVLILFFVTFCGIVIYVFTGRKRSKRLESYKYIPFDDEPSERGAPSDKVKDDGKETE